MSANNQILVKEHKGKYYVFDNVMAESWDDTNNILLQEASGCYNTKDEAILAGFKIDQQDDWGGTEYGVIEEVLCKDGADVTIIE